MTTRILSIKDHKNFKQKMLNWANQFNIFCFMDNNDYQFDTPAFDCMLAAGVRRSISMQQENSFEVLQKFYQEKPSWLFGHLGYGLKDQLEDVTSTHADFIDFGKGFFFEPEVLLQVQNDKLLVVSEQVGADEILQTILDTNARPRAQKNVSGMAPVVSMSKAAYLDAIASLQMHIQRGDCYEINFCQQFSMHPVSVDPLQVFDNLLTLSPSPFSVLYRYNNKYCLCASPERYLKKTGSMVVSQPIKGTSKRLPDADADKTSKQHLLQSAKERSENVMIVDLVRNDLSKICKEGTVVVDELFGIYSFPQVHQMISTIKGELKDDLGWTDAIKATFPMGSMTGAPKKRVLQLIDQYEPTSRGLFSGSIGYVDPSGNIDFNVVIRSIFYDEEKKKLSFSAGGGITANSIPEEEYAESLLKAEALFKVLGIVKEKN